MDKNKGLDYKEYFEDLNKYRMELSCVEALEEDFLVNNIIKYDMQELTNELGGQTGVYDNLPITKVFTDNNFTRVYALDNCGGVAIIANTIDKLNKYQIITLGEDDAFFFVHSRRVYEDYRGQKSDFIKLLLKAISTFNDVHV